MKKSLPKKIGIVGVGIVGGACQFGFEKLGHDVRVHDLKLETKLTDVIDTEIIFVCVPTPVSDNGLCDTTIVEEVIKNLQLLNYSGVVAIKSTVSPGTSDKLAKEVNFKLCFVPEFLRERCAISDFVENHSLLAIGSSDLDVYKLIKECHGHYPQKTIQLTSSEAEMLKYYSNIFNALRVVFANEIYELCDKLNINYTNVKNAYVEKGSIPDIYLDVNKNFRGYGGVCLPKDVLAISTLIEKVGLENKLIRTIHEENKKYKVTVYGGMRKS
jgi:UDPglucose 6-dehydrogenase